MKNHHTYIICFTYLLFFLFSFDVFSATRTASVSGNWSSTATWGGLSVPTSADDVIIGAGKTVTVDIVGAQCLTLTFTNNGNSSSLIISGTNNLSVTNGITYTVPKNNNNQTISVGSGNLSCASVTMANTSSATKYNYLTLSTGSISVSGNINCQGSSVTQNQINFSGAGIINIGGSLSVTTFTFTPSTGTINYNGGAQSVYNTVYYNLTLSGSGTKTLPTGITSLSGSLSVSGTASVTTVANLAISGNLNIGDGATFTAAGYNLTVTGTTTIGGGTSGILNFSSAAGTKIFTGLVTLNNGATWTNTSANSAVTLRGGITNNGTFNAGVGVYTFDTNSQAINGSVSVPNITVTGITLTNNGTLSVSTALNGSGGLTQGASSTLNIGFTGSIGITTLTATASENVINYNYNGSQNIRAITYYHLSVSTGGTKTLLGNASLNGNLNILAGSLDLGTTATTVSVAGTANILGSLIFNGTTTKTVSVSGNLSGAGTINMSGGSLLHILNLGGASNAIGTFTTAAVASTVNYNASGPQSVFSGTNYRNLTISGSGNKTLSGIVTVNNNLNISGGTLDDNGYQITGNATGTLTIASGCTLSIGNVSSATSIPTFASYSIDNNSTVIFNSNLAQIITPISNYGNITVSSGVPVTKSVSSSIVVNGTLSLSNCVLNLGAYDLNLGVNAGISGTFSSSSMILVSSGSVIKQFTSVPLSFTSFPIGTGSVYTPVDIRFSTASFSGTGSLTVKEYVAKAPNQFDNTNSLSKYWALATSNINAIDATLNFTYDQSEADPTYESAYVCGYYNGSAWSIGANDETSNTATISLAGVASLSGNYTAATEFGLTGSITYFARATGNWESASTWSTMSHTGTAASTTPIAGSKVDIGGGFTVTKTTSTALSLSEIIIDSDGILNLGIQTGLTVTTLNGSGKIQLGSGNFPSVTTNNFLSTTGSTIEFNNTTSFTLPVGIAFYQNLIISSTGTKTLGTGTTVNGDLNVSSGTLQLSTQNITVSGKTYVGGIITDNSTTGINSFNDISMLGGTILAIVSTTYNIAGNLDLIDGDGTIGRCVLNVNGTTLVESGRILTLNSNVGTKTFYDLIINGTWLNSSNSAISITGNLTVNTGATFTAGTAVYTFSGASKTIGGTIAALSLPSVTVSATGTITNNITDLTVGTLLTVTTPGTFTNGASNTVNATTALSGTGSFIQSTSSVLNLGGTCGITTLAATTNPNTVNYTGGAQTIKATTYYHLNLSGSGVKTMTNVSTINGDLSLSGTASATTAIAMSVGGSLNIGDGCTLTVGAFTLTVSGVTNVGNGNSGTILFSSATNPAKTFVGLVTINSGANWTENAAITPVFQNGLTCNGTYTASTGIHTFNTNSQSINGTLSIPSITVTGITLTNNGTLSVTTALAGTGGLTQGIGALLNIGGTSAITTLTASANPNTVNYNSTTAAQTVKGTTYYNLTITKTGQTATLGANTVVNSDLSINAGTLQPSTFSLTVSGTTYITGTITDASTTGTNTFNNVTFTGGTITGTVTPTFNVNGILNVTSGTGTFGAANFVINGATIIDASGNLTISSTTGTKTFSDVTVNGIWTNSINEAISLTGNLYVNDGSTFTSGTAVYTMSGTGKEISGTSTSLTITSLTITGTVTNNLTGLTVSNALAGTGGTLIQGEGSILNVGNTNTITNLNASTNNNIVNYNRAGIQTLKATSYYNLILSGTSAKTMTGVTTLLGDLTLTGTATATYLLTSVGGNINLSGTANTLTAGASLNLTGSLSIGNGCTFTNGAYSLTVNGVTNVGNGTSGTLTISSATGTKKFIGLVTINNGAIWNNSGNSAITFNGGITNNGTFTSGTGIQTFDSNSQALTGTFTISRVTVTGVSLTNNNSLTVSTALAGTGELIQSPGSTLNIGFTGSLGISTLTATADGNTVNYSLNGAQTVKATNYYHLILSGGNTKTLENNAVVSGNLTVSTGTFDLGTTATGLDIAGSALVSGTLSFNGTTAKIVTLNGDLSGAGIINMSGGSLLHTLNLGGSNNSIGTLTTAAVASIVNYNANSTQYIFSSANYRNLVISGGNYSKILSGAITVNNNIDVQAGTLDDAGYQIVGNGTGSLILASASSLKLGSAVSATTLPTFAAYNFDVASNAIYNSDLAQSISPLPEYGNLILNSTSPVVKNLVSSVNVNGNLTIETNNTLDVGGYTLSVKGSLINNAIHTGTGKIILTNGSASHLVSGTNPIFGNFELDDTYGAQILSDCSLTGNLTLTSGALTATTGNINVAGNFTNNSGFIHNNGTVTLNGISQIVGGTTGLTTFYNLIVSNGSVVDIQSNHNITTGGTLTVNGSLTLHSDASSTSTLIDNGIGGTGGIVSQRYLPGNIAWYTSVPVINGQGSLYGLDANNQMFYWKETTGSWVAVSGSDNLNSMTGYPFKSTSDKTINYTGNFCTGDKNIGLTRTPSVTKSGWNLVGNPYPSAIDWNATGWTKTNLYNNTFWIRSGGQFLTYNGNTGIGVPEGTTSIIPAHQAFWVMVDAAYSSGSLGVSNSARVHDNANTLKALQDIDLELIRINISKDGNFDQAAICFKSTAASSIDLFDSEKSLGVDANIPQIYSLSSNSKSLAINTYPVVTSNTTIGLAYKAWVAGNHTISIIDFSQIDASVNIYLKDLTAGVTQDMRANNSYTFNTGATTNTTRFKLIFEKQILPIELISFVGVQQNDKINLNWKTASEVNNEFFSIQKSENGVNFINIGEIKANGTTSTVSDYSYFDGNPFSGLNYYRLKQTDFDGKETLSKIISVFYSEGNQKNKFDVYTDKFANNLIISRMGFFGNINIKIIDVSGKLIDERSVSSFENEIIIDVNNYSQGIYFYEIYSNNGFPIDSGKFIKQ